MKILFLVLFVTIVSGCRVPSSCEDKLDICKISNATLRTALDECRASGGK